MIAPRLEPVTPSNIDPAGLYRYRQIRDTIFGGATPPTIRKWISEGKIPKPVILPGIRFNFWRGKDLLRLIHKAHKKSGE